MIYLDTSLDTSVALAWFLSEDRVPPEALWSQPLVASRLLEYEMHVRLHARGLAASHAEDARELLGRVALVEMTPAVLARALDAFPSPVRTLDALHLATMSYLSSQGQIIELATYDERLLAAASAMDIPAWPALSI